MAAHRRCEPRRRVFPVLSLVWDGAAARTTAQLAARLVLRQAGDQARTYQDAERGYRAALARRQVLAGDERRDPGSARPPPTRLRAPPRPASPPPRPPCATARRPISSFSIPRPRPRISGRRCRTHEAYLRIAMGSGAGFGVLVDRDGVHPFNVALTSAKADALVDRLRRSTHLHGRRLPDFDIEASQALYAALIGPVKDRLADGQRSGCGRERFAGVDPLRRALEAPPDAGPARAGSRTARTIPGSPGSADRSPWPMRLVPPRSCGCASPPRRRPRVLHARSMATMFPIRMKRRRGWPRRAGLSDACRDQIERDAGRHGPAAGNRRRGAQRGGQVPRRPARARGRLHRHRLPATAPTPAQADVIMLATHGVLAMSSCFAEPALLTSRRRRQATA